MNNQNPQHIQIGAHFNQINADKMWWPDSQLARFEMKSRFELWSRSPSGIIKQDTTLTDILLCQNTTQVQGYPTSQTKDVKRALI